LGAEYSVPWTYHPNAITAAYQIKSNGYQVWALENTPLSRNLFTVISEPLPQTPVLLITGNEVTGVDPGLLNLCDKVISIPMLGFKRSLNVAIAFGIAVYCICIAGPIFSASRSS
jgi:23S rRNA (guanosine2251-2'-O)-methyltransferase